MKTFLKSMMYVFVLMIGFGSLSAMTPVEQLRGWQQSSWAEEQGDFKAFLKHHGPFATFQRDVVENVTDNAELEAVIAQINAMIAPEADTTGKVWVYSEGGKMGQALLNLKALLQEKMKPASVIERALRTWCTVKDFAKWGDDAFGLTTDMRNVHIVTKGGEWSQSSAGQANQWVAQLQELVREVPSDRIVSAIGYINKNLAGRDNDAEFTRTLTKLKEALLDEGARREEARGPVVTPTKKGWWGRRK